LTQVRCVQRDPEDSLVIMEIVFKSNRSTYVKVVFSQIVVEVVDSKFGWNCGSAWRSESADGKCSMNSSVQLTVQLRGNRDYNRRSDSCDF
jgi:hypothetical protein